MVSDHLFLHAPPSALGPRRAGRKPPLSSSDAVAWWLPERIPLISERIFTPPSPLMSSIRLDRICPDLSGSSEVPFLHAPLGYWSQSGRDFLVAQARAACLASFAAASTLRRSASIEFCSSIPSLNSSYSAILRWATASQ